MRPEPVRTGEARTRAMMQGFDRSPQCRPVRADATMPRSGAQEDETMKLVTAVIQPHRLEAVKEALLGAGIHGLTVSEASGYGRQKGHTEVYRGAEYVVDLVPKIRIEVLVNDEDAATTTEVVIKAASSGQIGDGKVWTVPVEDVTRVRTGEHGPDAI